MLPEFIKTTLKQLTPPILTVAPETKFEPLRVILVAAGPKLGDMEDKFGWAATPMLIVVDTEPPPFVAVTTNMADALVDVGVPVILPDDVLSVRPLGKAGLIE